MSNPAKTAAILAARAASRTTNPAPEATALVPPVATQAAPAKKKGPWVKKPGGDFDVQIVPRGTPKEVLRQRRQPGRGQGGQTVTVDGGSRTRQQQQQRGQGGVTVSRGRNQGHGNVTTRPGSAGSGVFVSKKVTSESSTGVQAQIAVPISPSPRAAAAAAAAPAPAPNPANFVDLTVLLAYSTRPELVDVQHRLLSTQTVQPRAVFAHVNPSDKVELPPAVRTMIDRLPNAKPNVDLGAWARWGYVATVGTEYVLIIDDDCMPGPRWFEAALKKLSASEGHNVIAAAGIMYRSDQYDDVTLIGPEAPPAEEVDVDVGRGAWLMRTATARQVLAQEPAWPMLSTGLHVAAVVQALEGFITVLPYAASDRAGWGMLDPAVTTRSVSERIDDEHAAGNSPQTSAEIREVIYAAYREDGWMPLCVALAQDSQRLSADVVAEASAEANA
jgi:hypothetical protein